MAKPRAGQHEILQGDVAEVCSGLPDGYFDGCLCDPPYGLSFMGKKWDYDVPSVETWAAVLAALKPGAHLLAFAGTRTQHRMAVRIEDAGFEIRDMIAWVYGCLDEVTEVATENGVMPHHKTKIGDRVLCYDVEHGEYTYQPILEIVEYDYSDTAYRLVGDFGEQVVSRNHRVIVERGGREAFRLAETLECEARVPVLESLPALRQAVHDAHQGAGRPQQDMQCGMCEFVDRRGECRGDAAGTTQGFDDPVRDLRGERVEAGRLAAQSGDADVQQEVQRRAARCGVGEACAQRSGALVGRVGGGAEGAHDGRVQPSLEGGFDIPQPKGGLRRSADQVRAMPCRCDGHGSGGRLCHGASSCGGTGGWETADASGVRASHQPRCDGQSAGEPDAVCDERAAQGVRAWGGHRSAVVRVVPFHYTGKVWCLRVPTGAFVAVRNGLAFPTGNSGFPKSLDVSKAIDKAAGATRKVVGPDPYSRRRNKATATLSSAQWQGYGTALKPALEPITVARRPLRGTVAANVLAFGTGALNVDGCRVGTEGEVIHAPQSDPAKRAGVVGTDLGISNAEIDDFQSAQRASVERANTMGRWPANLIHDGSEEVLAGFPETKARSNRGPSMSSEDRFGFTTPHSCGSESNRDKPGSSGSAARFFYCAKASRSEREAGLDCIEIVSIESDAWGDEGLKVKLRVDTAQSPPRVTAVYGMPQSAAIEWSTFLFGRPATGQPQAATRFTTATATRSTTESKTLNWLVRSLTSDGIAVVSGGGLSGGSLAGGAERGTPRLTTTAGRTVSLPGVGTVASGTRLRINGNAGSPADHPTVKPIALAEYLARLILPPKRADGKPRRLLVPFCGSGSEIIGALRAGWDEVWGIEISQEYVDIAEARIAHAISKMGEK